MSYKYIPSRSSDELQSYALRAAKRIVENKMDPKEAVSNILKEEGEFTEEQIKRVCEFTNSTVTQLIMTTSEDRTVGIPLVNSTEMVQSFISPPQEEKKEISDYALPPSQVIKEDKEKEELNKFKEAVKEYTKDKVDYPEPLIPEQKKVAQKIMDWEYAHKWIEEELTSKALSILEKEAKIKDTIRQNIANGDFSLIELEKVAEVDGILQGYIKDVVADLIKSGDNTFFTYQNNLHLGNFEEGSTANKEHPLFKMADEIKSSREYMTTLLEALERVSKNIKELRR